MTATSLNTRAVLRLSGVETRDFLQGLVTQDVITLAADAPRWAALLSPQGKVLFDFMLWADGADILIDCEAVQADALAMRLTLYRLRRAVVIARDDALAVHWSPDALDKPIDPRLPALGHRWIGPLDNGDAAHALAWRSHRLALNVLEGPDELGSDQTLWLEANARELNGVDFKKGCYVGQENTARMHYRSKVNRRLVVVPLIQSDAKRQRLAIPELDVAIDHRRVEDCGDLTLPDWLETAMAAQDADSR